jgi:hypothetical protein
MPKEYFIHPRGVLGKTLSDPREQRGYVDGYQLPSVMPQVNMTPPIGPTGDGADGHTPAPPGTSYSRNLPNPSQYQPPMKRPGWMRGQGLG